jgi:hypothetical protein
MWNPLEKPYRIRRIFQAGSNLYGWSDTTEVVSTEKDGRDAVAALMPAGCTEVQLHMAIMKDGRHVGWKEIAKRKRKSGKRS